jgi:hypothetical protein
MNTIHHFGDSYGVTYSFKNSEYNNMINPIHFVELCSQKLNKKYINYSIPGNSNEFILKQIIENINRFKKNDIVFIQFSYFCRGCWWNETEQLIENTNSLYDETYNNKYFERANNNKKLLSLLEYYIEYTEDYSRRIFAIINLIIKQLINMGIDVFFIHADDSQYVDSLLSFGHDIKFEKGFAKWLLLNHFHNEEDGHYTKDIQTMLADLILNVTNKLKINNVVKLSDFNKELIYFNKTFI